jgi:uncharacterized protein
MDITPLVGAGRQIIQSYAAGRFRITGQDHDGAVIVFPDHTESWPQGRAPGALVLADFSALTARAAELDVVLFGCGAQFMPLPVALRHELRTAGLSVDIMDTGAACRTYNVLMAEGRRVAAALLPV